jgi:hypothetical protein
MKQKIVEQTVGYLRTLPKEERMVVLMDMAMNVYNNIDFNRIEIAGVNHCIQMEIDRDICIADGVEVKFMENKN